MHRLSARKVITNVAVLHLVEVPHSAGMAARVSIYVWKMWLLMKSLQVAIL